MKFPRIIFCTALLLAVFAACLVAGCTTASSSPQTPGSSATGTPATAAATPVTAIGSASGTVPPTYGISTTVTVHYNDFSCIDIQKGLGVTYLFPDEKYTIAVAPPSSGAVAPNMLVLDVTDYGKLGAVKPSWDAVKKSWLYEGIVPLVKMNDVSSPQTATLTIKDQGAYYVCIDDRKETGTSDTVYQVPVQVTKN